MFVWIVEAFYRTHKYLVEHLQVPVRRGLMDEIDWNDRLIGIKGSRGVGKTTVASCAAAIAAISIVLLIWQLKEACQQGQG